MTGLFIGLGVASAIAVGCGIYLFVKNRNDPFNRMYRIYNNVQNMANKTTRKARRLAKRAQKQTRRMQRNARELERGVQEASATLGSMSRDLNAFQGEMYDAIDSFLSVTDAISPPTKKGR